MKVHTKMIHRMDTPVKTFKNHDEYFQYVKNYNNDNAIRDFKKANQIVGSKKPKRNDPCICGSGKKFKKCCINKELV